MINFRRRNFFYVIHPDHAFAFNGALHRLLDRHFVRGQTRLHRAARSQVPGQRTRVDSLDAGDFPFLQIFIERHFRTPVARCFAQFFDHKSAHVRRAAFLIERIGSVISNQRISHGHDLAAIGRIGQHFLITGHRGVEADLADPGSGRAK